MTDFWTHFNIGLKHMLDLCTYTHILFLIALTVPFEFKSWKKLLILVSLFTLGHTVSSLTTIFNIITVKSNSIAFLIPIIIFIIAFYNILSTGKSNSKNGTITFIAILTSCFGIIHGLGYSNYFNSILPVKPTDKVLPLFEFALGIEISQIIVVILGLLAAYIIQTLFKFTKRDWTLTISAFIVGVVIPMILQSEIWHKIL